MIVIFIFFFLDYQLMLAMSLIVDFLVIGRVVWLRHYFQLNNICLTDWMKHFCREFEV